MTGTALFGDFADQCVRAQSTGAALPLRVNAAKAVAKPHLQSYAKAITEMRKITAKDPNDPRGWIFQANMHWTPSGEMILNKAWNQCEHGTRWFLPWHRGYIYFFERIIRQLSGDEDLALPYWKWDDKQTRSLPAAFRTDKTSPLYDATRGINDGTDLPGVQIDWDLAIAMGQVGFDPAPSGSVGFSLQLDESPHGLVHVEIDGNMGRVPTAARDPVFFLHHANVDRLWNRWLDDPRHANPMDEDWLKNKGDDGVAKLFQFFDENKMLVKLTTEEVLKMTADAYRYDDDKEKPPVVEVAAGARPRVPAAVTVASASRERYQLANKPLEVKLALGTTGVKRLSKVFAAPALAAARAFLVIQGISVKPPDPSVHYYVYLRSSKQKADEPGEYIGTVHFFSRAQAQEHGHDGAGLKYDQKFDVTEILSKLGKPGAEALDTVTVRFVPVINGRRQDKKALEPWRSKESALSGLRFRRLRN